MGPLRKGTIHEHDCSTARRRRCHHQLFSRIRPRSAARHRRGRVGDRCLRPQGPTTTHAATRAAATAPSIRLGTNKSLSAGVGTAAGSRAAVGAVQAGAVWAARTDSRPLGTPGVPGTGTGTRGRVGLADTRPRRRDCRSALTNAAHRAGERRRAHNPPQQQYVHTGTPLRLASEGGGAPHEQTVNAILRGNRAPGGHRRGGS